MYEIAATFIKAWEGCKLEAYQDVVGIWTIGYGHTGPEVTPGLKWSQQDADAALLLDIHLKADGMKKFVTVPLSDNETAALLSLAFNIGLGALKGSTCIQDLNAGDKLGACAEFARWHRAGGKRVRGLLRRRIAEMKLFTTE